MEITRIPVDVPGRVPFGQTNVYVVGGSDALLVDPAAHTPALDGTLEGRSVAHVAVTHHHPDHVGAVSDYARACDATVWAHRGRESDFEAAAGIEPDRTFGEGTAIPVDDENVFVVETPGHAPEHVAFDVGGSVLAGDLVVASGSVSVGLPDGDVRAYVTSLRRLLLCDPEMLYPAHGPVVDESRAVCERLIAHRLERESRVLDAIEAGADSVDSVLERAYDRDLTGLDDLARSTVEAHLAKLRVEGKIPPDSDLHERRVR